MRGAIAEISGTKAIMLTESGEFITLRNKNYSIGQKVVVAKRSYSRFSTLAACLLLLFMFGGGAWGYYTPVTYVDIDINPSFRLEINIFDRVIDVKPLNEDAKSFLKMTGNLPDNMEACLSEITTKAKEYGYINEGNNDVYIYSISQTNDLQTKLNKCIKKVSEKEKVHIYINSEKRETLEIAKKHNVSVGRIKLIEEYSKIVGGTIEDNVLFLKGYTNKEIISAIDDRNNQKKDQKYKKDNSINPKEKPENENSINPKEKPENENSVSPKEKTDKKDSEKPTEVPERTKPSKENQGANKEKYSSDKKNKKEGNDSKYKN